MKRLSVKRMLGVAFLLMMLTSCSSHEHVTDAMWELDSRYHWLTCDTCDKAVDKKKHDLDDKNICTVCAAEVKRITPECTCPDCNEPDSYLVKIYDERGNTVRQTDYDLQGNMTEEYTYEREYDDKDRLKREQIYYRSSQQDQMICEENNYLPLENGDVYRSERILYDFDGSKIVALYDEQSRELSSTDYDANGNITSYSERGRLMYHVSYDEAGKAEYKSVYEYDDEGNAIQSVDSHYGVVTEMTEYGEAWTVSRKTYYNDDGTVKREENYKDNGDVAFYRIFSYDKKGNLTRCVEHPGGGSRRKVTDYALDAKGNTYVLREAVFNNEVGDITETTYDAAGNVIKQETLPDWRDE